MKKIRKSSGNLNDKKRRVNTIELLVRSSTEFRCENVEYEKRKERIIVFSSKNEMNFFSTNLITKMMSFNTYLTVENNRIELHIY